MATHISSLNTAQTYFFILGSGSDAASMLASYKKEKDCWILNGTKAWVTSGIEGKAVVVFANGDRSKGHLGISAFIIPIPTEGKCFPLN